MRHSQAQVFYALMPTHRKLLNRPTAWFAGAVLAAYLYRGFTYPVGIGWRDELLDFIGMGVCLVGALVFEAVCTLRGAGPGAGGIRNPGGWAIASGAVLILGNLPVGLALSGISALMLALLWLRRLEPSERGLLAAVSAWWRRSGAGVVVHGAPVLCWICALSLCVEIWEDAVAPGGPKPRLAELSVYGVLLAVLGLVWSGFEDGWSALYCEKDSPAAVPPVSSFGVPLWLFGSFVALTWVTRFPAARVFDMSLIRRAHVGGDTILAALLRGISNAGGGWLIFWVAAFISALLAVGQSRTVRFFGFSLAGAVSLSGAFKVLIHRARPPFSVARHFDSYPSGHVLAATVLAGLMLAICLPACKTRRGKAVLRAGAAAWPLLMSVSRVCLGLHYPTDAMGGIVLGCVWVSFCRSFLLSVAKYAREADLGRPRLSLPWHNGQ